MFPVLPNICKSREEKQDKFSRSDSTEGDADSARVECKEERNFESSEFESYACVFVPSSIIESDTEPSCRRHLGLESMLRNKKGPGEIEEHTILESGQLSSSSDGSMKSCQQRRRNEWRNTSHTVENGRNRSRSNSPCKSSQSLLDEAKNIRPSLDSGDEFRYYDVHDQDQTLKKHSSLCKDKEERGRNGRGPNVMYVAEELKYKRLMGMRNAAKREEVEIANRNRMAREYTETFWTRLRNAFSMACWRGHVEDLDADTQDFNMATLQTSSKSTESTLESVNHDINTTKPKITPCSERKEASKPKIPTNSSEYEKSTSKTTLDTHDYRSEEIESEDTKTESSQTSSLSTENTTVVPSGHIPQTPKHPITPSSSKDKFMAVKLVASLKRFFSTNSKTYDDDSRSQKKRGRASKTDESGEDEDSIDGSENCRSTNRPLSPRVIHSFSSNDFCQSTDSSNCEVININSKHRQPM